MFHVTVYQSFVLKLEFQFSCISKKLTSYNFVVHSKSQSENVKLLVKLHSTFQMFHVTVYQSFVLKLEFQFSCISKKLASYSFVVHSKSQSENVKILVKLHCTFQMFHVTVYQSFVLKLEFQFS